MHIDLALIGAGGEPVDLQRTLGSHGLISLAPNVVANDACSAIMPLRLLDGTLRPITIAVGPPGMVRLHVGGGALRSRVRNGLIASLRHMLALDDDLAPFYQLAARDPDLQWVQGGAGRFMRSQSVFEDVIKTICTTNCSWSATQRMTSVMVAQLGEAVPGSAGVRAFPTPQAMAAAEPRWYSEVARVGYRGAYLHAIARAVSTGALDFGALVAPERDDAQVEHDLLALPGIGPYAAAHIMLLVGRYGGLVLDSSTRPKFARLSGTRPRSDAPIRRRFARYGRFAGLAFWCYLTRDWIEESAESIAANTAASDSSARA